MYSFKWYYSEPLFNILSKDFPWFTSTRYLNLCSLCSYTVIDYAYITVSQQLQGKKLPHLWIFFANISAYLLG